VICFDNIARVEQSSARQWIIVFAVWTALVVLFVSHAYLYSSSLGEPMNWQRVLPWAMALRYE